MVRRTLCGVVESTPAHVLLKSDDVVVVTLCETTQLEWTRIDFPHVPHRYVLSTVMLDDCGRFPIPFTLYYNDGEIDENLCYGVRCDVLDAAKETKMTSERFIPVLTEKHPKTNVHIPVASRQQPLKGVNDQAQETRQLKTN